MTHLLLSFFFVKEAASWPTLSAHFETPLGIGVLGTDSGLVEAIDNETRHWDLPT